MSYNGHRLAKSGAGMERSGRPHPGFGCAANPVLVSIVAQVLDEEMRKGWCGDEHTCTCIRNHRCN